MPISAVEVMQKLQQFDLRERDASAKLRTLAKMLLPVLKDHKLDNVASDLGALLFEFDALDQERKEFVLADPKGVLEAILGGKPR